MVTRTNRMKFNTRQWLRFLSHTLSSRSIMIAIHHAMTRDERIPTLQKALLAFSHKNTDLHSYEVDMGAVHALILQLGFCLSSRTHQTEIDLICQCLCQILSQCPSMRKVSIWQELGITELVPLLLQAGPQAWSVLTVQCQLSVAKTSLIEYPGLLDQAVHLLQTSHDESVLQQVLEALKDLSFQSEPRCKQILWKTKGLTEQLVAMVDATRETVNSSSKRQKECIAMYWWNLAISVHEMQADPQLLTALQQLLQDQSSVKIRQCAIAALGNLLSSELLRQNDSFWNLLLSLALREVDTACRRRVVRSLRCLLATAAPARPSAMYVLVHVAVKDGDTDIRLQALEGLRHLQPTSQIDCWTKAMVGIMESGGDIRITWMACQMLSDDAVIRHPSDNFWKAASQMIESIQESHANVTRIMSCIIKSGGHDKLLASPVALLILAQLLLTEHRPLNLVEKLLATEKQRLAECDALLSSLVTICLSTSDMDEKDLAKSIILQLVPEL